MLTRKWLIVLPSVIAVAAIGLGTWQVVSTRSELDAARQQLTRLRAADAKQLAKTRGQEAATKSALATATQSVKHLQSLAATTTTTTTTTTVPAQTSNGLGVSLTRGSDQVVTGTTFTLTATIWRTSAPSATVNGSVTFSNDGAVLSFCRNVTLQLQIPGLANIATCSMNFTEPGTYDLSAFATSGNGETGSSSLTITVSS